MALLTGSFALDVFTILAAFVAITIAWFKWKFQYWKVRGLELDPPVIPFGNMSYFLLGTKSPQEMFVELYRKARSRNMKHCGFYTLASPTYIPIDPEIIKCIMQRDFDHFMNHGISANTENDPLNGHLFNLKDAKWRDMRVKLTPTFTSGKMKMMFQIFAECGEMLQKLIGENSKAVDIKEVLGRFSTDIIGSCAFGLEINSLNTPDSEFRKYGKKIFEIRGWKKIRRVLFIAVPESVTKKLNMKLTEPDVENFFMNMVRNTVKYREENNVERNDFLQLLLHIKNQKNVTDDGKVEGPQADGLSIEEIAAQCFVFFVAGFETSSSTMTWCLYELARNPEIQTELRNEINTVMAKHGGVLTYEAVMEMNYLDKVIKETLRMYPSLPALMRKCNKEYKVPGTDLVLEEGTQMRIPVIGLQTDPEYFPNPEKFDPERFSEEAKNSRHPFTYLPFGDGPRQCIGMRFGLMQSKIGVMSLVRNYKIKLNSKTAVPMVFSANSFFPLAKDGIWLDFEKI